MQILKQSRQFFEIKCNNSQKHNYGIVNPIILAEVAHLKTLLSELAGFCRLPPSGWRGCLFSIKWLQRHIWLHGRAGSMFPV